MSDILYDIPFYLLICINAWLISHRFNWFSRQEVSRDVKSEKVTSTKKVKALFRYGNKVSDGDYRIVIPHSNDEIRVEHKRREKLRFEIEETFLRGSDSISLGRASKMIGFIEWRENPSAVVKAGRLIVSIVIGVLYLFALIAALSMLALTVTGEDGITEVTPVVFLLMLIVSLGNIIMTLKEFVVYVWQNKYSIRILEGFNVEQDVVDAIERYLKRSYKFYIAVSILKFLLIMTVLFLFGWYM